MMNLATDPWIPVVDLDGRRSEVDLSTLFSDDGRWADLNVRPHERVSLMRFLICLSQAALNGPGADEREEKLEELPASVNAYMAKWRHQFNLFDPVTPFLQIADLEQLGKTATPVSKLDSGLATGNNTTLFDHGAISPGKTYSPRVLSLSRTSLSLITFLNYSLGGLFPQVSWKEKKTKRSGVNDAPCASQSMLHAFIRHNTVLDTIRANILDRETVEEHYGYEGWGRPIWEMMPESPEDTEAEKNATRTYLGRLVPLSRWIKLQDNATDMLLGEGYKYPVAPNFPREPTASEKIRKLKEKETIELINAKSKAPWRELHSITIHRCSRGLGGPLTLRQYPENQAYDLLVTALIREQASELDTVESVLHVPKQLDNKGGRAIYKKEIHFAEKLEQRLAWAVETYRSRLDPNWQETVKNDRTLKLKLRRKATAPYWTRLEGDLNLLMKYIQSLGREASVVDKAHETWQKAVRRAAAETYRLICGIEGSRRMIAFTEGWAILFPVYKRKTDSDNERSTA